MADDEAKSYDFLTLTLAKQFAMPPDEFRKAVISQCFPGGAATDYQLTQFLMVAYNRQLNPFEKGEIYAFVNKHGVLTIGTGIDGWIKIAHRQPTFRGYKATELFNDQGEFVGVHMQMFREGWAQPGEYTAYLTEWNKQVLNVVGWTNQPRHLTFTKAWQECTRFTFQVTDVVDADDIQRMEAEDAAINGAQPIYQPGPAEPRAIEHQPAERADFIKTGIIPEPQPVHTNAAQPTGHLRVKVELPEGPSSAQPAAGDGMEPAANTTQPPTEPASAQSPAAPRRGRPAGAKNKPKLEPDPIAAVERQQAAGLEVLDPAESELETFIRANDLNPRRVDATLAKFGADTVRDLNAEDAARVLDIFKKSLAVMEAAKGA